MDDTIALFIVIADDDLDDHLLINEAVKTCNQNHIVTSVYNGAQLLDLLLHRGFYKETVAMVPDLILLDIRMPVMNGLEALEEIRKLDKYKLVPIYILSQDDSPGEIKRAKALGVADYFIKPLVFDELKELMLQICRTVHLSRKTTRQKKDTQS
jgi:two-component system response regulator